nr:hypothetical protein [Tanacetum cinerariifolium]
NLASGEGPHRVGAADAVLAQVRQRIACRIAVGQANANLQAPHNAVARGGVGTDAVVLAQLQVKLGVLRKALAGNAIVLVVAPRPEREVAQAAGQVAAHLSHALEENLLAALL